MKVYGFKDLVVWQKSFLLTVQFYELVKCLPKDEIYGLSIQMKKSSVSIVSNIAEGYGRLHKKEYKQFLAMAYSSLCELETQYLISVELNYFSKDIQIENLMSEVGRMLYRMIHPKSTNS